MLQNAPGDDLFPTIIAICRGVWGAGDKSLNHDIADFKPGTIASSLGGHRDGLF